MPGSFAREKRRGDFGQALRALGVRDGSPASAATARYAADGFGFADFEARQTPIGFL